MEINADDVESPETYPHSLTCTTPSASGSEQSSGVRRRPIPRKGHTKSRRGCFNCKRRKVKCQETLPECGNCTRIGLVCEYPDIRSRQSLVVSTAPSLSTTTLQSTPTLFTPEDMRFFHHFLVNAYPPLPIRGDDIWRQVAPLSHSVRAPLV